MPILCKCAKQGIRQLLITMAQKIHPTPFLFSQWLLVFFFRDKTQ
jgi:hypothetical protein